MAFAARWRGRFEPVDQNFGVIDENFPIQQKKLCYGLRVRAGLNGIQKADLILMDRTRLRGPALMHERKHLGHGGLAVFG